LKGCDKLSSVEYKAKFTKQKTGCTSS